jgi:menaquinone-dependent protoporphyrinogen oxidase
VDGVVLVAYASKHGSTREIAERICETIQSTGLRAHLRPAAGVDDLDGYGGVVLGGSI